MNNKITTINLPNIKIINKGNKSYNSYSDIFLNNHINFIQPITSNNSRNRYFNKSNEDTLTNKKKSNSNSNFNSPKKKINLKSLISKTNIYSSESKNQLINNEYYLPFLSKKKIKKENLSYLFNDLKNNNKIKVLNDKNKNCNSLYLNIFSNNNKKNIKQIKLKSKSNNTSNNLNNSKIKNNKKLDILEQIKIKRKRFKEQMINRYKVQYLHSSIKLLKEKELKKENKQFAFNYDNNDKSIENINKKVNNALNDFYSKIPDIKATGADKIYFNYSNSITEKNMLDN